MLTEKNCKIPTLCLLGIMQYLTNNSHSGTNSFFPVRYKNLIYRHKEAVTLHCVSLLSQNVAPELSEIKKKKLKLNTELQHKHSYDLHIRVQTFNWKWFLWLSNCANGGAGSKRGEDRELSVVFLAGEWRECSEERRRGETDSVWERWRMTPASISMNILPHLQVPPVAFPV